MASYSPSVITPVRCCCSALKKILSSGSCLFSAGVHAFGLVDWVLWIVAEFSTFNHCGSDLSMIFICLFSWMLAPFCNFFHCRHFLSTSNPLCLMISLVNKDLLLLTCHYVCIFWKMWDTQGQWSFLFVWNFSRIGLCMLYGVALMGAHGMPELTFPCCHGLMILLLLDGVQLWHQVTSVSQKKKITS